MCKDVEARYKRQLAEKDSIIRRLVTMGESKTVEGSVLRAELRRIHGILDELREGLQGKDRTQEMELPICVRPKLGN